MRRPVIGIATQTLPAVHGERPRCWMMGHKYVEPLRRAGAVPWLVPLVPDDPDTLHAIADKLDGVFLTGGVDVDPSCYGEPRQNYCGVSDPDRDAVELLLLGHALRTEKPVLAVCRGLQVLNVALGGTLYQDIATQLPGTLRHDYFPTPLSPSRSYLAHSIDVKSGTRLRDILGESVVPVNSMHHQAIKSLGSGLVVTATAPDGVVEAAEVPGKQFLVAVQWHPEELAEAMPAMHRLFTEFVAAA